MQIVANSDDILIPNKRLPRALSYIRLTDLSFRLTRMLFRLTGEIFTLFVTIRTFRYSDFPDTHLSVPWLYLAPRFLAFLLHLAVMNTMLHFQTNKVTTLYERARKLLNKSRIKL